MERSQVMDMKFEGGIAALAGLLHETAEHHGAFEAVARHTTGGTGMRRTWTPASAATARRRRPRPPGATWRRSSTSWSDPAPAAACHSNRRRVTVSSNSDYDVIV